MKHAIVFSGACNFIKGGEMKVGSIAEFLCVLNHGN